MPTVAYLNEIFFFFLGVGGGGGVSVLFWADIAHGVRTNPVVLEGNLNAQLYRDEILERHVIPLFQNNANITLFYYDNATSHTARDTVNFPRANNIAFINDWPAKSPDLNPIENHWNNLDQRVRRHPIPPLKVIQLRQALIREWNNIQQAEINTLIRSMHQRRQAILHAEGGHTRYLFWILIICLFISVYLSSLPVAHPSDAPRRQLVVPGDNARIQDETTESSA